MISIHRMRRNPRGFTLVELLVVIGIISVLISILLPALNKARESAKTIQCASNMKQVMLGLMMYAQDNKGYLPVIYSRTDSSSDKYFWPGLIAGDAAGYVKDVRALFCPSRIGLGKYADLMAALVQDHPVARGSFATWNYVSYALSRHCVSCYDTDMPKYDEHPVKLGQPGVVASTLGVLYEAYEPDYALDPDKNYYGICTVQPTKEAIWTHAGGLTNVAYLDGHVVALHAGDLGWDETTKTHKPNASGANGWRSREPWFYMTYNTR